MEKLDRIELLEVLKVRFNKNKHRHKDITFDIIMDKLSDDSLLQVVFNMEKTEGMPDVVTMNDDIYIIDMYKETPKRRSSICYDKASRLSRTKFPPVTSAFEMIDVIGSKLLDESMYRYIQGLEDFDLKTSCWLLTPKEVRSLGGALFGDKRYNNTYIYHNGADSYYSSRGFRSYIELK